MSGFFKWQEKGKGSILPIVDSSYDNFWSERKEISQLIKCMVSLHIQILGQFLERNHKWFAGVQNRRSNLCIRSSQVGKGRGVEGREGGLYSGYRRSSMWSQKFQNISYPGTMKWRLLLFISCQFSLHKWLSFET